MRYAHNHGGRILANLKKDRPRPDTNLTDNPIPSFAAGRMNWLFSDSPHSALSSAKIERLIETAKANTVETSAYLRLLFERLPSATTPWPQSPSLSVPQGKPLAANVDSRMV